MAGERIVAVGLLTQQDIELLGPTFDRLWPVDDTPKFDGLLEAIDEADRRLRAEGEGGGENAAAALGRTSEIHD